jgi:hypothetical protein
MNFLVQGNTVHLKSLTSLKNLRINANGVVDGNGGDGKWAQFIVHVTGPGKIKLQCVGNPQYWLTINQMGFIDASVNSHSVSNLID